MTAAPTGQTCSVVTRGRRSGTEHVVRVWFVVIGPCLHAAARGGLQSDWLQNALHAGSLEVRAKGGSWQGGPSLVPDDEARPVIEAFAEKYRRYPRIIDAWRAKPPVFVKVELGARPDEPG